MKTKSTAFDIQKSAIRVLGIPALILMIPLVAMQFTNEVKWDETDFIVIGILLISAALGYEIFSRIIGKYKIFIALAIVAVVAWLWAELAVGIFTNWGS